MTRGEGRSDTSHFQETTRRHPMTIVLFINVHNYHITKQVYIGDGGINQEDFDTEGMDIPSETTCISGTPVLMIILDFTK